MEEVIPKPKRSSVTIVCGATLLLILFLACGPIASPQQSGGEAQAQTEPTLTPKPTAEPTPEPHKPPLPDRPLRSEPEHPGGFEACKNLVLFQDDGTSKYRRWCGDQLAQHITNSCESLPDADEQRQCGENIVSEYRSLFYRLGPVKCAGVYDGSASTECVRQSMDDLDKGFARLFEAADKVQIGGNRDPAVVEAMDEAIKCLEDEGFKNVNRSLLFTWQSIDRRWNGKRARTCCPQKKEN